MQPLTNLPATHVRAGAAEPVDELVQTRRALPEINKE
jgi:hypothetical protein